MRDAIYVGRRSPHNAEVIRANIEPADVVGHDQENVRLLFSRHGISYPFVLTGAPKIRVSSICSLEWPFSPAEMNNYLDFDTQVRRW